MARKNWQKLKLLKLADLLREETDEGHPLTTAQICSALERMGIPCDRRTLSADIALLNELNIEVQSCTVGKSKGYFTEDRCFSVPELKILIDAVQAAGFITPAKTEELIDKIANLGGKNRADELKNNLVCFNTRKHSNERIYYSIDALEAALQAKKKIRFRYYDLGISCEKLYRREGRDYLAEPVALVFNEDNYYAVCYSEKYDNTANYRIDRMDAVEVLDEAVCEKALELRGGIGEYTEQAIKMYGGEMRAVELEFDSRFIGAVYDRFGEATVITKADNGKLHAAVKVQLSPTFRGWLCQFEGQLSVISPQAVVEWFKASEPLK